MSTHHSDNILLKYPRLFLMMFSIRQHSLHSYICNMADMLWHELNQAITMNSLIWVLNATEPWIHSVDTSNISITTQNALDEHLYHSHWPKQNHKRLLAQAICTNVQLQVLDPLSLNGCCPIIHAWTFSSHWGFFKAYILTLHMSYNDTVSRNEMYTHGRIFGGGIVQVSFKKQLISLISKLMNGGTYDMSDTLCTVFIIGMVTH